MIGGGYIVDGTTYYPITAPVLIIVGCMMAGNLVNINWKQWDKALPSFLIVVAMPLTYRIALGFITYPLIKVFSGKGRYTGVFTSSPCYLSCVTGPTEMALRVTCIDQVCDILLPI